MLKFRGSKRVKKAKIWVIKNKNDSHCSFSTIKLQIRETQHNSFSQYRRSFDIDRQFTRKLNFSDFNSSNFSCFWTLFGPRNLSIAWNSLYQTDLDRDSCNLWLELSFEKRFDKLLAHFCFSCTWYEWFKKLGQHSTLQVNLFFNNFSSSFVAQLGTWLEPYDVQKSG